MNPTVDVRFSCINTVLKFTILLDDKEADVAEVSLKPIYAAKLNDLQKIFESTILEVTEKIKADLEKTLAGAPAA